MKILIAASNMVHINNFHLPYVKMFKENGHQVYIMARGEGADFDIGFKKRSLSLKNYRLSLEIRKILAQEDFDVVYLHTSLAAFWVRMAIRGLKKKPYVVNTVHGYLFGSTSGMLHNLLYLSCEKMLKKQTDEIIVMNKEDHDIAVDNKLCKGKISFSRGMGVNFKAPKEKLEKPNENMISLAFVGEISKRKNQLFLVKAMKELQGYSLTLVGDGDGRAEIEKYIKKEHLEDRVYITGFTKQAYEYISSCDIYVSASKIEGLPFNIMEAMYLSKPIIASNIKGHKDLLAASQLYESDNMAEYVSLVKKASLGRVSYDIEKYSFENVAKENMSLYLSTIEKIQPKVELSNS